MKILLSPAKGINMDNKLVTDETSVPVFLNEASSLVNKLKKMSVKKIGEMMSLSKELAVLNVDRYQDWKGITVMNGSGAQAVAAFNGEVYRGLDAATMTKQDIAYAQKHIRILSGLYGVLKPLDIMCPYRLEMGTKWAVTPAKKNLYQFWGSKIVQEINNENEDGILINLASNEYFKAIDKKMIKGRIITCVFKEFKDGDYKVVMVYAKKARGLMARYIVDHKINDPEQIKLFDTEGYMFDVNLSTDNEWVFTR